MSAFTGWCAYSLGTYQFMPLLVTLELYSSVPCLLSQAASLQQCQTPHAYCPRLQVYNSVKHHMLIVPGCKFTTVSNTTCLLSPLTGLQWCQTPPAYCPHLQVYNGVKHHLLVVPTCKFIVVSNTTCLLSPPASLQWCQTPHIYCLHLQVYSGVKYHTLSPPEGLGARSSWEKISFIHSFIHS